MHSRKKYPPVLADFPHIVHGGDYNPDQWLDEPEILSEDVRLMKLAGMNNATLAIFAWSAIEPEEGNFQLEWLDEIIDRLYRNGIYTILATPSGARPAWLDQKYPEARRTTETGVVNWHGQRHNHCMSSPIFREKVRIIDTVLAEHYRDHPAVKLWHISNEFNGACYCEHCKRNFRSFLRKKYQNDIHALNKQWWTAFWSHTYNDFDQIDPPSSIGETCCHGLTLDWKRFVTYITADFFDAEAQTLKAIAPHIPVTTNIMGYFPGLDYWSFSKHLDVVSWDSYPIFHDPQVSDADTAVNAGFQHDLMRSMHHKPYLMMESSPSCVNWHRYNKPKHPGMHYLSSMQALANGSDSVQYFQWRKSRGSSEKFHGAVVDHEGSENTRVFREVASFGKDLKKLDEIVGTDTYAQTAIIYDWENEWAISGFQGYGPNRNYTGTVQQFYRCFFNHAANVDFMPLLTEPRSGRSLSDYPLVIAPMIYSVSEEAAARLTSYVENGGTLICTYLSGYVNENDLCYLGGFPGAGLRKLFGIWAEEMDPLYPSERVQNAYLPNELSLDGTFESVDFCEVIHPEGAEVIAEYRSEFYAGLPSITVNRYGKGSAYFIGTRQSQDDLEKLVRAIADKAGVSRILPDRLPDGVKALSRTDYRNEYVFLLNYATEPRTVDIGNDSCVNLIDGKAYCRSVDLPGYGVMILKRSFSEC